MTTPQLLVLGLLATAMAFFVQGRWRHDVVAFGALLLAVLVGVVPADQAFVGFGHPAVFTVAAILVVSRALQTSGALDGFSAFVGRLDHRPVLQAAALVGMATGLSAFMNNVGALALVMPVALANAQRNGRPASLLLMPIAFGASLGGLITLIGTPPNLIVSQYRETLVGAPFPMFGFTPVGLPLALCGAAFLVTFGRRLLPADRRGDGGGRARFEIRDYVAELQVPHDAPAIGRTLEELTGPLERELDVLGLIRSEVPLYEGIDRLPLRPGDVLVLRADSRVFDELMQRNGLEIAGTRDPDAPAPRRRDLGVMEVVVPPGCRLEGRSPGGLRLHSRFGIHILAVARRGRAPDERLAEVVLKGGDVLLMQGEIPRLAEMAQTYGALPLAERGLATTLPRRRFLPLWIFGAAIALTAAAVLPVHVAFGVALLALVLTHSVTIRQLYETIDWSVIVLLGAMLPLGDALRTSGATERIAGGILELTRGGSPALIVALLLVTTTLLTNVINNAATAVVMAPLAGSLALQSSCDPDAFLMAVAVGASCAFATPIGHQNNVLVMGPGGYRFGDYMRVGLPLSVVTLGIALPILLTFWPPRG
jgi:di/tricarboxylate transporter